MSLCILPQEEWASVPGYHGLYMVSSLGRVYGVKRKKILKVHNNNKVTTHKAISLSCKERGKPKRMLVHRLVAMAFIENTHNKPCINHIDCNPENNRVDNLEWCTHKENTAHACLNNRMVMPPKHNGQTHPQAKLTNSDVIEIKKRLSAGDMSVSLAKDYGVTKGTIGHIKRGLTWTHIN